MYRRYSHRLKIQPKVKESKQPYKAHIRKIKLWFKYKIPRKKSNFTATCFIYLFNQGYLYINVIDFSPMANPPPVSAFSFKTTIK